MKNQSEFERFSAFADRLLSVPKATILRREAEYRKGVDANQSRRGPKRKSKPSASPAPSAS